MTLSSTSESHVHLSESLCALRWYAWLHDDIDRYLVRTTGFPGTGR